MPSALAETGARYATCSDEAHLLQDESCHLSSLPWREFSLPDPFLAFLMEDLEKRGGGLYESYVARGAGWKWREG